MKKLILLGFCLFLLFSISGCTTSISTKTSNEREVSKSIENSSESKTVSLYSSSEYIWDFSKAAEISSENDWISTVTPADRSTVDSESNISIIFKRDMEESTLNAKNIIIEEGKYSRNITNLFSFHYSKENKTLYIDYKIENNSCGTGNWVLVYLKKAIRSSDGVLLDSDYYFQYNT
jgi:hypothetical protein